LYEGIVKRVERTITYDTIFLFAIDGYEVAVHDERDVDI
jgi:hypothetical protein